MAIDVDEGEKSRARQRSAATLLLVLGVLTIGTGVYFLALRPALLPEDTEFTGVTLQQLPPAVAQWLGLVFRTWGGFIAGFGFTLVGVAVYLLTSRPSVLTSGVALGILVAFGRFFASNLRLHSDFLWFIEVLFAIAVVTAVLLWLGTRRHAGTGGGG